MSQSRKKRQSSKSEMEARATLAGIFHQLVAGAIFASCTNPKTAEGVREVQEMIRDAGVRGAESYRKQYEAKKKAAKGNHDPKRKRSSRSR